MTLQPIRIHHRHDDLTTLYIAAKLVEKTALSPLPLFKQYARQFEQETHLDTARLLRPYCTNDKRRSEQVIIKLLEEYAHNHDQHIRFSGVNQVLNYMQVLLNEHYKMINESPRTILTQTDYIPLYPDLEDELSNVA